MHGHFSRIVALARCLAIITGAVAASACSLVGPQEQNEYVVQSFNGNPLPAAVHHGTTSDGRRIEEVMLGGRLILFEGGRYAWESQFQTYIDGLPDPSSAPRAGRYAGASGWVNGEFWLNPLFSARPGGDDLLLLQDEQGIFGFGVFEVAKPDQE